MISPPLVYTGLPLTRHFESCRLVAYWDALGGVWTIGWGHTKGVKQGDTCTQAQADAWLLEDMQFVIFAINRDCTLPDVTQGEFNATVDLGFNIGLHALEGSTLWRKWLAGDLAGAAAEFVKWDHAAGKEVYGLLLRRQAEEAMFLIPAVQSTEETTA